MGSNEDKFSFKLTLEERPSVTHGTETEDSVATFLAESLGLIPARGKGLVSVKLIQLLSQIAGRREATISTAKGQAMDVKNGAIRVEDAHKWLLDGGADIGIAQLYNTYIAGFQRAGLITKKKYSMYGLKGDSLKEALKEVEREWQKNHTRVLDHAEKLVQVQKK